jgi:hypothetical protein
MQWIQRAWNEIGASFGAVTVPVARYILYDVDDIAFPFMNKPIESWRLVDGDWFPDPTARILRVPYVAFAIDEVRLEMRVQAQWASRCGYGYVVSFGSDGKVVREEMKWVS